MNKITPTLPLISINRHRMGIDGKGVTTLVGAFGCPLSCAYCLNPEIACADTKIYPTTPEELLKKVIIDDLYFLASGGGIAFGGGESLLHGDYLCAFKKICPSSWKITLETCLNVPPENLKKVLDIADYFVVDIKDMNPATYEHYTGKNNNFVLENLKLLIQHVSPDNIKIRVPLIPHYNKKEDLEKSTINLRNMGFTNIEPFSYVIR